MPLKHKAYLVFEEETEKLKQLFAKRRPEFDKTCSKLRSAVGSLQPVARRRALILIQELETLDEMITNAKKHVSNLQQSLNIDRQRDSIIQHEKATR